MTMRTKIAAAFAAVAIVGVSAGAAYATTGVDTLYDNLNETTQGANPYSDFTLGPLANSFSTGSTAVTLGTVSVMFQEVFADPPSDYATVSLFADNNSTPGALIATLGTVSDSQISSNSKIFSFNGGQQLAADTRYWIEVSGTDGSAGAWNLDGNNAGTGVAGEYFSNANGVSSDINGAYQMDVTAQTTAVSAAPEPSTWLLMMVGIGGAGLWLRRAKKSFGLGLKAGFTA